MSALGGFLSRQPPLVGSSDDSSHSRTRSLSKREPTDEAILTASLDDVTTMTKILQELHHTDDQSVLVMARDGIRFVTAGAKTFQVSAFFPASVFQRYEFKDGDSSGQVNFKFTLRDFIENLNILRDDPYVEGDKLQRDDQQTDQITTSLYIQYRKKGDYLRLKLENKSNCVISCYLIPFDCRSTIFCPFTFQGGEDTAVIVLNSKKLYEYVSGLDLTSSDYVRLSVSLGPEPLRLSTRSTTLGEVELVITDNERDIIRKGIVMPENCEFNFSYRTQFMRRALEALKTSYVTQMKCASSGLLCFEHFHPTDKGQLEAQYGETDSRAGFACHDPSQTSNSCDLPTDHNQPQIKRSSVEYFILSEVANCEVLED